MSSHGPCASGSSALHGSFRRCGGISIAWTLAVLLGSSAVEAQPSHHEYDDSIEAAVLSQGLERRHLRSDIIVSWNSLAHDIAVAEDQFLTFKGQRALAIMHLAMHDALNTIVPIYERYAYTGHRRLAHPAAATAQAAHDVLLALYPPQRAALAEELARWLAEVPQGVLRDRGTALG
jgi:hypothetical protein